MFTASALTLAASLHLIASGHAVTRFVQNPVTADAGNHDNLEPDRPDVTNGTHIVDVGLMQMEIGGVWNRSISQHSSSTPTTMRIGLADWLEARISTDGFLSSTDASGSQRGIGNVQLGSPSTASTS